MRITGCVKVLSFFTVIVLIYIHMQMQIFALAYEGQEQRKKMQKIKDQNGAIAYNILTLKSANHLGRELLTDGSSMQFASNLDVIELQTLPAVPVSEAEIAKKEKATFLSSILSRITPQAEAGSLDKFKSQR